MSLAKEIRGIFDSYDRITALKDKFKGETIYITTPGPSLLTHDREKLISKLRKSSL